MSRLFTLSVSILFVPELSICLHFLFYYLLCPLCLLYLCLSHLLSCYLLYLYLDYLLCLYLLFLYLGHLLYLHLFCLYSCIPVSLHAYTLVFSYWCIYLFLYYKTQLRVFLSMELINLYNIISITISAVISLTSDLSKVITLGVFIKYKILILRTPDLAISSHVTINNTVIIWIYYQAFSSLSNFWL